MALGEWKDKITIQKSVAGNDKAGNHVLSWQDYYICHAYVNNLSGSEYWEAAWMAVLTLEETKQYLRVDSSDEDGFISGLIETGERLCADVARMEKSELEAHLPMVRIAVLYAAAYLYEHREQADHGELVQTLRSLLFGIRKEVF